MDDLTFLMGWLLYGLVAILILLVFTGCIVFVLASTPCPANNIHHLTTGVVIAKWVDINSTGCFGICPQDILDLAKGWENVSETASWQFRDDSGSWVRTKSVGRKGTKVDVWEYLTVDPEPETAPAHKVFWSNFFNEIQMRIVK